MRAVLVDTTGRTVPPMLALAGALTGRRRRRHRARPARASASGPRRWGAGSNPSTGSATTTGRVSLEEQLELTLAHHDRPGARRRPPATLRRRRRRPRGRGLQPGRRRGPAETVAAPTAAAPAQHVPAPSSTPGSPTTGRSMAQGINETRRSFGPAECGSWTEVFAGHDRLISVVPEVFDASAGATPSVLRHFGFFVPPPTSPSGAGSLPEGDDPAVLVGLNTTNQGQGELRTIVDGLGRLPVRALVTTGGVPLGERPPAERFLAREFVPHQDVLAQVDLVVTHGGLGTIAAALAHGVPPVCTPIGRDQPLNTERVIELGAGRGLGPAPAATEVVEAVEAVLGDPAYRQAAQAIGEASRRSGGAATAATDLLSLAPGSQGSQ